MTLTYVYHAICTYDTIITLHVSNKHSIAHNIPWSYTQPGHSQRARGRPKPPEDRELRDLRGTKHLDDLETLRYMHMSSYSHRLKDLFASIFTFSTCSSPRRSHHGPSIHKPGLHLLVKAQQAHVHLLHDLGHGRHQLHVILPGCGHRTSGQK